MIKAESFNTRLRFDDNLKPPIIVLIVVSDKSNAITVGFRMCIAAGFHNINPLAL